MSQHHGHDHRHHRASGNQRRLALTLVLAAGYMVVEVVGLENAPRGIDVDEVQRTIRGVPGVLSVHDLHVWTITSGMDCLSAHVVAAEGEPHAPLLGRIRDALRAQFGIHHLTIQIEPEEFEEPPCAAQEGRGGQHDARA